MDNRALFKLQTLAAKIRTEYAKANASAMDAVEHAVAAGRLLAEAKATVAHGKWLPWLKANCPEISERRAQAYIQVSKRATALLENKSAAGAAYFSLRDAHALIVAEKREDLERKIKQLAVPEVTTALESRAIDLREAAQIVNHVPKEEQAARVAELSQRRAEHQAQQTAFGVQELATTIRTFLSEGGQHGQKLKALHEVADQVSWEEWGELRDAFDRLIEAALLRRAEVVEALREEATRYDEGEISDGIRDEGPRRFIRPLTDYLALADGGPRDADHHGVTVEAG